MTALNASPLLLREVAAAGDDAYQIERSLRLNHGDSPNLRFTQALACNTRTWTFSAWIKRNLFGNDTGNVQAIFCAGDGSNGSKLEWSSDTLHWTQITSGSVVGATATKAVYRDPSAWYHVVMAYDSTQATEADRIRIYVNGKLQSQTVSNTIEQHQATWVSSNKTFVLGGSPIHDGGRYCAMLITEAYLIDGLALPAGAFGSFDSNTGAWDPKEFSLPAPNTNKTWSGMLTAQSGSFHNSSPATNLFDGKPTTTGADDANQGKWIKFTPTDGIAFSTGIRVYNNGEVQTWEVKLTDGTIKKTSTSSAGYHTLYEGSGTLEYILDTAASGDYNNWYSIEIDGVSLVDGVTDPTTRSNPNNGTTWSDATVTESQGGGFYGGSDKTKMFDGDLSTSCKTQNTSTITWTPASGIPYNSSIEIYQDRVQNGATINGSTATTPDTANAWNTLKTGSGTLTSLSVTNTSASCMIAAIRIDGHVLLDKAVDNSFYLKFNDTTKDRYLGKSTFNGNISGKTGGLPILNTDATGDTKTSGYRTDSSAGTTDAAGLLFAATGESVTAGSMDVHASINTGSSTNTMVITNSSGTGVKVTEDESRFYGKSLHFAGNSDPAFIQSPVSADFELGTSNFTWEAWIKSNWDGNEGADLWVCHGQGGGSGANDYSMIPFFQTTDNSVGKMRHYCTSSTGSWNMASGKEYGDIRTNEWVHYALVRNGSTFKGYENGIEKFSYTSSASIYQDSNRFCIGAGQESSYCNGYIQDIRFYKTAKYTANFTVPNRKDLQVNNVTASENTLAAQPTKQFHTVTYSGSGGDQSITGVGFKPDLVMIKCRSHGKWPPIADVVNGAGKFLHPNSTEALATSNHIKTFDSDGFTVTDVDTGTSNESGMTYVAWCWKAGGTATSNSDGSITSSVSVNPNNTLSIIKYTGTGANATVGHGLNKAPKMLIIKSLSDVDDWYVYHYEAGANKYLWWNKYDARQTNTTIWQNTHPTSSVITLGAFDGVNESGDDYICYAFAEQDGLCAIGKYTGNGSNSGPTVNVGFRPAWITIKNWGSDDSTPSWLMIDSVRGGNKRLWNNFGGNSGDTEDTQTSFSFSDTGFTLTDDGHHNNGNEEQYYYITFAADSSTAAYGDENVDSFLDSPTNYESDGTLHGNYCTWNPLAVQKSNHGGLRQGNLEIIADTNGSHKCTLGTMALPSSGKWYWEVKAYRSGATNNGGGAVGVAEESAIYQTAGSGTRLGEANSSSWVISLTSFDAKHANTVDYADYLNGGTVVTDTKVIGIAVDMDNDKMWMSYNGTWGNAGGTGNPVTGAYPAFSGEFSGKEIFPAAALSVDSGSGYLWGNFGQRDFDFTIPTGFKPLCTHHINDTFDGEDAGILNNPSKFFGILTYTGDANSSGTSRHGLQFNPDMVWIKSRSFATNHHLHDRVITDLSANGGVIYPDIPNAGDFGQGAGLTAFNSDGFTTKHSVNVNKSDETFVAWCWDAGTAANTSGLTDGTIDISSGNQWVSNTAGISITKYVANGTNNATVSHGLSTKPDFVAVKNLDSSSSWAVWFKGMPTNKNLFFDDTSGMLTPSSGYTYPVDNSVIKLVDGSSNNTNVNNSGDDYIMYCFTSIPGYSRMGTYEGNNDVLGPFVYTGFRPRFLLTKCADTTGGWGMVDTTRDIDGNSAHQSGKAYPLQTQVDSAEDSSSTDINLDFLSNGFKPRTTWNPFNSHDGGSGTGTMVYMAFAENPFKLSRAK